MHVDWLHSARLRLSALRKRPQLERDLEDEIRFHLEMKAAKNASAGLPAGEAFYAARRDFGNDTRWKEALHDMWTLTWPEGVIQDARYAARSIRKTPGLALAVIAVLAIGIGANTAIFSVVNAAILKPLPFSDPDELVLLIGNVQRQRIERRGNSYPDYLDWRSQAQSFAGMAAIEGAPFVLTGVDEPERFTGEFVSAGYFELLGVRPLVGRVFQADEDRSQDGAAVAVIGEDLWKRRFGGDSAVLGRKLTLNARPYTVIGVMPAWFRGGGDQAEVWAPFSVSLSREEAAARGRRGFTALARLKKGVSRESAQTEMDGISRRLEMAYPATNEKRAVEVASLTAETVGSLKTPLLILLGAVTLVLLIACANVANLLLARSEARQGEFAIRMALGAGRGRLFRQQMAESLILAGAGAALGLVLAVIAGHLLVSLSPVTLPTFVKPRLDWMVGLFTVVISVITGFAGGMAPALAAAKQTPDTALKDNSIRSGEGSARQRFRSALVISEVALATALLVGAGLLIRSFGHLSALNPGFQPENVLTVHLSLPRIDAAAAEATDARSAVTGDAILERVQSIPSVVAAAVATGCPLDESSSAVFYSPEGQTPTDATTRPRAYIHRVSPAYFATLRTPLVAGRTFNSTEMAGKGDAVMVTENLVRRFWPGQDPVGKRIKAGSLNSEAPWLTIVGVVPEMKFRGLPENPTSDPDVFFPFSPRQRQIALLVRTSGEPGGIVSAVRAAVRDIDRTVPVYNVASLSERVGRANERARFASWMMAIFAAVAIALTSVGIYALMSWTVRRRTREIGIRMAVGASREEVLRMILGRGMTLVGAGLIAGAATALALTRWMETLLFGVSPADSLTFSAVAILIAFTGALACLIPAWRAAQMDPAGALRHD